MIFQYGVSVHHRHIMTYLCMPMRVMNQLNDCNLYNNPYINVVIIFACNMVSRWKRTSKEGEHYHINHPLICLDNALYTHFMLRDICSNFTCYSPRYITLLFTAVVYLVKMYTTMQQSLQCYLKCSWSFCDATFYLSQQHKQDGIENSGCIGWGVYTGTAGVQVSLHVCVLCREENDCSSCWNGAEGKGMLSTFQQCLFYLELPEMLSQNLICCYHWMCVSGNYK